MNDWDKINMTSGTHEWPEPPVVKFLRSLSRERNNEVVVLDIGPGRSGRHSRLVEDMGLGLISVDVSHACRAHYHADIHDMVFPESSFDCILDIKTLCQEPHPPYKRIHSWLKPLGYLFSMMPGEEHLTDSSAWNIKKHTDYEYEYMRMVGEKDIVELLCDFSSVGLYKYVEPVRTSHSVKYLYNWCVEAQK
jgi:hypothetical protein